MVHRGERTMAIIKNIVKCTPEQYLELLKNGEVEVNGEIKTYSENTLYDTGNLELLEWYNKMMAAQYQELQPAHTPYIMKTLEQEITDIIKEYPDYQYSSVIGYRAYLKKGDIVGIKSTYNNGEWFINGKRVEANYSYNGNGTELVSVVGFETGYYVPNVPAWAPVLGATPSYYPYEIYIKNIGKEPEVAQNYYLYANKITTYNFNLASTPKGCRVLITNGTADISQAIPVTVQEVYSNCERYTTNMMKNNTHIKKVSMPNCKEITGNASFSGCSNITSWEWGKLEKIVGSTNISSVPFSGVNTVVIPDTVKNITTGWIAQNNKTVKLECNKAKSIVNDWIRSFPTNFSMAKNWDASVNISIAAKNWTQDRFIELFEELVPCTMAGGSREITIPMAMYDAMCEDETVYIAEDKGWIVGGA